MVFGDDSAVGTVQRNGKYRIHWNLNGSCPRQDKADSGWTVGLATSINISYIAASPC